MKLIIDIPNYNLKEVQNGSIASKVLLEAVKNGKPYEQRPQGDIHDFIAKADEGTLFQLKKEIKNALTKIFEREAYEEARREAMRLDDNEDTYKYRGYC